MLWIITLCLVLIGALSAESVTAKACIYIAEETKLIQRVMCLEPSIRSIQTKEQDILQI